MASIRCGNCGGVHDTIADVRACSLTAPRDDDRLPFDDAGDRRLDFDGELSSPGDDGPSTWIDRPVEPVAEAAIDPSTVAGPDSLGRWAVVSTAQALDGRWPAWRDVERIVIDEHALADPTPLVERLSARWHARQRTVIELAVPFDDPPRPAPPGGHLWGVDPTATIMVERLHHLVWSNTVDLRDPSSPRWRLLQQAVALGATAGGARDVVLPDGTPAWCDGGPMRHDLAEDGAVVHRVVLEHGSLEAFSGTAPRAASALELAPDQLAAVTHPGSVARIIAPAGSGKTRVLTERARHLLHDWRVPASALCLVAFNERAAAEMRERTTDLPGLQVRTLNALGYAIVDGRPPFASRPARRRVIEESEVRSILDTLVTVPRRLNTDPMSPWLDALAMVRIGLRDPDDVEAEMGGDVDGLAEVVARYTAILRDQRLLDFDEQILGAIDVLLREPAARAAAQRACRLLLVDEFQDLAPAHLLLVRLLASPDLAVFGVGDDDQTIYGFSGATPEWLIRYLELFPGAGDHPLEVNYRCPPPIVTAANALLRHNGRRVPKAIRAADVARDDRADGFEVVRTDDTLAATAGAVESALAAGAVPAEVAVLTRVNATLAPVQLVLRHRGVAVQSAVGPGWLDRTGVRAALAWLRLATEPEHLRANDVREAARRPPGGRSQTLVGWMAEQGTIAALRRLAGRVNERDAARVASFADDLEAIARAASDGTSAQVLRRIRAIGLDDAMRALDGFQRSPKQSGQLDDLDALIELAAIHPAPATFEPWLRDELRAAGDPDGVRLATVHRVKGREWPYVVLHDAGDEQLPHRLADDLEEERRIFHVAITRASRRATVVAPRTAPSPFVAEAMGEEVATPAPRRRVEHDRERAGGRSNGRGRDGRSDTSASTADPALAGALREWRRARAKTDAVPAYVVFSDATLEAIASAAPSSLVELGRLKGIGPAKLERYGGDILAVVAESTGA
jgi:DNA helicase-2/ATP-dependent DNA helicase PcrA